jgi:SPP1 family predicted phage head-tail adaptor
MTAPVRAGALTRPVSVESRSTQRDSFGGQSTVWTPVKTVYAAIEALSGSELVAAQQFATEVSHRFTVRYDAIFADPKAATAYRLVYRGRIFNITAPLNIDEADRTIELLASEGLNNG